MVGARVMGGEQDGFARLIAEFDATLPRGSVRNDSPADIKKWLAKESRLANAPPPVTPLSTTRAGRRRRAPDRYQEVNWIDGCMHEQHQLQEFFRDLYRLRQLPGRLGRLHHDGASATT